MGNQEHGVKRLWWTHSPFFRDLFAWWRHIR